MLEWRDDWVNTRRAYVAFSRAITFPVDRVIAFSPAVVFQTAFQETSAMRKLYLQLLLSFGLIATGAQAADYRTPGSQRCAVVDCSGKGSVERAPAPRRPPPDPNILKRQQDEERLRQRHAQANEVNRQGQALYDTRDWNRALALFIQAIELDPGTTDWRWNRDKALVMIANDRGRDFSQQGEWAKAIAAFEEALKIRTQIDTSVIRQNLDMAREGLRLQQSNRAAANRVGNAFLQLESPQQKNRNAGISLEQAFQQANGAQARSTGGDALEFTSSLPTQKPPAGGACATMASTSTVNACNVPSGLSKSVGDAIAGAYRDAPPGVSDRVRKGFQAVGDRDWKVAKAWFQDALNRDPGNPGLKRLVALSDAGPARTRPAAAGSKAPPPLRMPADTRDDPQFLFPKLGAMDPREAANLKRSMDILFGLPPAP